MTQSIKEAGVITAEDVKQQVNAYIESLFNERIQEADALHPRYTTLWKATQTLFKSGGKRMRPYLVMLAYTAYGGDQTDAILPAAVSQELLHQAMLIHDDIIDRDTVRYGTKNVSGQYVDDYLSILKEHDARHFADGAAVIAGDFLLSEAFFQLNQIPIDGALKRKAYQSLHTSVFKVVGGELLDTEASFYTPATIDPQTVSEQKTTSYSFVGPLSMGAILAGAPDTELAKLKTLAGSLGLGFQLRDDILGIYGDSTITGKSTDGDLREGKRTLLMSEFDVRATKQQKEQFYTLFGKDSLTTQDTETLRALIDESGARQAVEAKITACKRESLTAIEALAISTPFASAFTHLVTLCLEREK